VAKRSRPADSAGDGDGDGGKVSARYDRRRREVVDKAARVFAERGYHATSIEDLVEATGLQRGGLYHYMDGKKDLLSQIHHRFIEPLLEDARGIVERGGPPDEVLRNLGGALIRDIASYGDQVTVFLHEWRIIRDDPEWGEIRQARKDFEALVGSVLRRGMDEGVFAIRDERIALLGFLGMFNYSYQWFRPGGRVPAEEVAEEFCDIFLDGIRA
jgi:AcrR family transcriptional regulator